MAIECDKCCGDGPLDTFKEKGNGEVWCSWCEHEWRKTQKALKEFLCSTCAQDETPKHEDRKCTDCQRTLPSCAFISRIDYDRCPACTHVLELSLAPGIEHDKENCALCKMATTKQV